ncbi:MAG: hypothetical protein GXO76_10995 [Calditrichaeota bacterium]|nr:hypothetical protein [Calditrichota bacterium]
MKSLFRTIGFSTLFLAGVVLAGNPKQSIVLQNNFWGKPFLSERAAVSENRALSGFQETTKTVELHKSPKKALLFSALLPGAGEFYAESYWKSALFAGIEVGSWVAYAHYQKKGVNLESDFKRYADQNWSYDRWKQWYDNLPDDEKQAFSHTLPSTKTQQYYEMIGKYMEFNAGWDDVKNPDPDIAKQDTSKKSLNYMEMRERSNRALKVATAMTAVVLANHVLSAVDAAWTAKVFKKTVKQKVEIEYIYLNNRPVFMAQLKTEW